MNKSAIILAIDTEQESGEDRALLKLCGKPLIDHVLNSVKELVEEVILVGSSKKQESDYFRILHSNTIFVEIRDSMSDLAAAAKGFEAAHGAYSIVLPADSPFVSREVASLLFDLSSGKSAVVPRWPSHECEPLHAVYNTTQALEACRQALAAQEVDLTALLTCLRGVRYLSTLVIEQIDPDFRSFFRVKTPLDLKKATALANAPKHR